MKSMAFDPAFPPHVGMIVLLDGQRYEFAGIEPHQRQDGTHTELMAWRSHCADCAAPIITKTPFTIEWPTRRCQSCKAPGKRAAA